MVLVAALFSGGTGTVSGTTVTVGGTIEIVGGTDLMTGGAAVGGGTLTELVLIDDGGTAADAVATSPVCPNNAASFWTNAASASGVECGVGATATAGGGIGGGTESTP